MGILKFKAPNVGMGALNFEIQDAHGTMGILNSQK